MEQSIRRHAGLMVLGTLLAISVAPLAAVAQAPDRISGGSVSIERLKVVYLGCERAAQGGAVSTSDAMACSVVYEELKRRAFGGDFGKLRTWSEEALLLGAGS